MTLTSSVPHIDDVTPVGPQDEACLAEVRQVLDRYGALNRFGISLLHSHFEMEDDEIMKEVTDVQSRSMRLHVAKASGLPENALFTQFRFAGGDTRALAGCIPTVGCIPGTLD